MGVDTPPSPAASASIRRPFSRRPDKCGAASAFRDPGSRSLAATRLAGAK